MRDDVLILLNERESAKLRSAEQLEEQVVLRGLAVSRIKPQPGIAEIVRERRPRVLVLDYLLGDYGTAIDVLSEIQSQKETSTILWTDEASAHVAVTAMQAGANDYIEMGINRSLDKVLNTVQDLLNKNPLKTSKRSLSSQYSEPPSIPSHSSAAREMLTKAENSALSKERIIVLLGERGSGRNTLAKWIHSARPFSAAFHEMDFDLWDADIDSIFSESRLLGTPLLTCGATVMLDHVEFDSGELLDKAERWRKDSLESETVLIVGTSCLDTAQAWERLCQGKVITIPSLAERKDDILPFAQNVSKSFDKKSKRRELECTPELINAISSLEWPGNMRQLQAAIVEAITADLERCKSFLPALPEALRNLPSSSEAREELLQVILWSKNLWEQNAKRNQRSVSALKCKQVLGKVNGNLRIAAAMMGTSIQQVRELTSASGGE